MKKQTKIVVAVFVVLIIAIAILAYLNRGSFLNADEAQNNAEVVFCSDGKEVVMNREHLLSLPAKEISATIRSSGQSPRDVVYTGVAVKDLFDLLEINYHWKDKVVVRSADGYTVAAALKEVLDKDNAFLCYEMNGEPLKSREQGGEGPYQFVLIKDQFSQRWGKYVIEIEVT